VPPGGGEARVAALQRLDERDAVHHGEPRHRVRVVQREPQGDVGAAVVPRDREALVAQRAHQGDHVPRHRPLGGLRVIGARRRRGRLAVAAEVGADDRVVAGEQRGDAVPGGVRAGVAV
jgi:hypothetical protein